MKKEAQYLHEESLMFIGLVHLIFLYQFSTNRVHRHFVFPVTSFLGSQLLGMCYGTVVCLKSENGCDIDNDDGLLYCAQKDLLVIFETCPTSDSLDRGGPSQFSLKLTSDMQTCGPSAAPASWPTSYVLPQIPEAVRAHILKCANKEEASVLKCSTSFCNAFLKPIVDDILRYNTQESWVKIVACFCPWLYFEVFPFFQLSFTESIPNDWEGHRARVSCSYGPRWNLGKNYTVLSFSLLICCLFKNCL